MFPLYTWDRAKEGCHTATLSKLEFKLGSHFHLTET